MEAVNNAMSQNIDTPPTPHHNTIKEHKSTGVSTFCQRARPFSFIPTATAGIRDFLGGHCGMESVIALLLIVTLTAATPLRPTDRPDSVLPVGTVQSSGLKRDTQEQRAKALKVVPFHSEVKHLNLEVLKHRLAARLRPRRAPQRGCQVGTCQVHNLAHTLYEISQRRGKDGCTKVNDPQGYGR